MVCVSRCLSFCRDCTAAGTNAGPLSLPKQAGSPYSWKIRSGPRVIRYFFNARIGPVEPALQ